MPNIVPSGYLTMVGFRHSEVRFLPPQPAKSLVLHSFMVWPKMPANTGHVRRVVLSLCLESKDEVRIFACVSAGQFWRLVFMSAWQEQSVLSGQWNRLTARRCTRNSTDGERSDATQEAQFRRRVVRRAVLIGRRTLLDACDRKFQWMNPNAARWSAHAQGIP